MFTLQTLKISKVLLLLWDADFLLTFLKFLKENETKRLLMPHKEMIAKAFLSSNPENETARDFFAIFTNRSLRSAKRFYQETISEMNRKHKKYLLVHHKPWVKHRWINTRESEREGVKKFTEHKQN